MAQPTTPPPSISRGRRWFLLVLFCVAQFLEVFYTSAIFLAIPAVSAALHMTAQEGAWLIASYQLTFASFLLVVSIIILGYLKMCLHHPRVADLATYIIQVRPVSFHPTYIELRNAEYVFVTGFLCFGLLSLGSGFCNQTIGLLVVRAFAGLSTSTFCMQEIQESSSQSHSCVHHDTFRPSFDRQYVYLTRRTSPGCRCLWSDGSNWKW